MEDLQSTSDRDTLAPANQSLTGKKNKTSRLRFSQEDGEGPGMDVDNMNREEIKENSMGIIEYIHTYIHTYIHPTQEWKGGKRINDCYCL